VREEEQKLNPKIVLFVCTGNYYRSRFAELLFNNSARRERLGWQAISRGLELNVQNVGPISSHVCSGLRARGVDLEHAGLRSPLPLALGDLLSADRVVALKRAEHLPIIKRKFPRWASRIEYWHVDDLDFATPDEALRKIEDNVTALIKCLSER
jgi:protein-tyrosine phosphatase